MSKSFHFLLIMLLMLAKAVSDINGTEHNETTDEGVQISYIGNSIRDVGACPEISSKSPLDEYPEYFTEDQLRDGWIALHVFAAVYFFVLLAIVCNDYFLPTVECICEDLNLSKDVAAATFMATATTMPEFFTNTISTFQDDADLGLGTIIGSLMFNTLGVAGLAALAIKKPIQLDWWPISRDCCIYIFNTLVLLALAWGGYITFVESCIMVLLLIIYYVITFNNNRFMPVIRVFVEDKMNCCLSKRYDFTEPPENSAKAKLPMKKDPLDGDGVFVICVPENMSTNSSTAQLTHSKRLSSDADATAEVPEKESRCQTILMQFWWAYTFPIKFFLGCIIPNPIKHRRFYPVTFIMCIFAIGFNAYMIVWMLTAFGVTMHIPQFVMGLTFLAAGSATPEAVSSLISLRKGENGIGVSNSLGANSLAILLSLGVPWFIKNCIKFHAKGAPDEIDITSATQGIEYSIIILLLCTFALFIVLSLSGNRLTKRVGVALFATYTVLIILQILLQVNFFFESTC